MCNYIIEGGIDFYSELMKDDNDINSSKSNDNMCLLSAMPLSYNNITLPCTHKFNYEALYQEVIIQKHNQKYGLKDNIKLTVSQFKCPYCRTISNKLLPHVPLCPVQRKIVGVNSPAELCMEHKKCEYLFASGKQKGKACDKYAFESKYGTFCNTHWRITQNRCVSKDKKNIIINKKKSKSKKIPKPWTQEMQKIFKDNKVVDLRNKLREYGLKVSGTKYILVHRLVTGQK